MNPSPREIHPETDREPPLRNLKPARPGVIRGVNSDKAEGLSRRGGGIAESEGGVMVVIAAKAAIRDFVF